jgi:exodeoxyribonuclease VII small subunit
MPPKKPTQAADAGDPSGGEAPGFEQALERLETIVEQLEAGSLTLEQSLASYEEGVKLSQQLNRTLDRAAQRIEQLAQEGNDKPTTRPSPLDAPGVTRPSPGEDELPF